MTEVPAPIEDAISRAVNQDNLRISRDQYEVSVVSGTRFIIKVHTRSQRQNIADFLQRDINHNVDGFNIPSLNVPTNEDEPVTLSGRGKTPE